SLRRQQLTNLSGEITRPQNSPKKILRLSCVVDERADASAFHSNKRRELLQPLRDAPNARGRRIGVEKPVIAATSARAPKCAQDRRDIHARANAVADHGNVRQPRDQLSPSNLPIPVSEIIRIKTRRWPGYTLQQIRTDHPNRLPHKFRQLTEFVIVDLSIQPIHRPEQTAKLCVVNRDSGQPFANWFALPPSRITNRREMITIQPHAHITRRRDGK